MENVLGTEAMIVQQVAYLCLVPVIPESGLSPELSTPRCGPKTKKSRMFWWGVLHQNVFSQKGNREGR